MVARTTPIGVKLKPDQPQSDEERLRILREKEQRLIAGIARTHAEIVALERQLKDAA